MITHKGFRRVPLWIIIVKIIGCNRMSLLLTGESTLKKNISFHFTNSRSEPPMWELAPHVRALCLFRSDPPRRLWSRLRWTATVNWWSDNPPPRSNCKNRQIVDQSERQFSQGKRQNQIWWVWTMPLAMKNTNSALFFLVSKGKIHLKSIKGCYPCTKQGRRG